MDTLYISKDATLVREDNTLVIKIEGKAKRRVPINTLQHVIVSGECGLTTSMLCLLGSNNVRVTILDWYGNTSGTFEPIGNPRSGTVRLAQAQTALDDESRLEIAKLLVDGAMSNILANLRYRLYRGNRELQDYIDPMEKLKTDAKDAKTIEALMGYEGNFRSWYYKSWKIIDERLDFGTRIKRPPNNPLNCLISWFNSLCYSLVRNELAKTHLDDCVSFLHSPQTARSSLALDLAEIFKPVIVDTVIFSAVLRGTMKDSWFNQEDGVCLLNDNGRKETLEIWSNKVDDISSRGIANNLLVRQEALSLERHLLGIDKYKPYVRRI